MGVASGSIPSSILISILKRNLFSLLKYERSPVPAGVGLGRDGASEAGSPWAAGATQASSRPPGLCGVCRYQELGHRSPRTNFSANTLPRAGAFGTGNVVPLQKSPGEPPAPRPRHPMLCALCSTSPSRGLSGARGVACAARGRACPVTAVTCVPVNTLWPPWPNAWHAGEEAGAHAAHGLNSSRN